MGRFFCGPDRLGEQNASLSRSLRFRLSDPSPLQISYSLVSDMSSAAGYFGNVIVNTPSPSR